MIKLAAIKMSLVLWPEPLLFEFLPNLAAGHPILEPLHHINDAEVDLTGFA